MFKPRAGFNLSFLMCLLCHWATGQATSGAKLSFDDRVLTADPPIINAVAAGNTTITAGSASADVTVIAASTLPTGTVLWSNPGDGSGVSGILPAVPSSTGVADVFAFQGDGSVQAITSTGTTAWTAPNVFGSGIPDFQGGLVVNNSQSVYKLDGLTGQPYPAYASVSAASGGPGLSTLAVHTDGTIFTVDGSNLVGINPLT
ncbi:MAG: hypothetical protein WAL56_01670, partial [Candidatus Sulfotelmatobacter sp.]